MQINNTSYDQTLFNNSFLNNQLISGSLYSVTFNLNEIMSDYIRIFEPKFTFKIVMLVRFYSTQ